MKWLAETEEESPSGMPERAVIDGVWWKIISQPGYRTMSGEYGRTTNHDLTMVIDADVAHAMLQDTLMHEHLHAMSMIRLASEDQLSERQVMAMAPCILMWMRANPGIVEWLQWREA